MPKSLPSVLRVLGVQQCHRVEVKYEEAESVTMKEPKEIIRCNEPILSFMVVFYILCRARRCSVAVTFTAGKKSCANRFHIANNNTLLLAWSH